MLTRGIKHDVDRFIRELAAKYLPFKFKTKAEKKETKKLVQVAVRPIQLWEVVFPEEHQDLMLNTLFRGAKGKTQHKRHFKWVNVIRKILGVSKIPDYDDKTAGMLPVYDANVERVGIGIKQDRYQDENGEML